MYAYNNNDLYCNGILNKPKRNVTIVIIIIKANKLIL